MVDSTPADDRIPSRFGGHLSGKVRSDEICGSTKTLVLYFQYINGDRRIGDSKHLYSDRDPEERLERPQMPFHFSPKGAENRHTLTTGERVNDRGRVTFAIPFSLHPITGAQLYIHTTLAFFEFNHCSKAGLGADNVCLNSQSARAPGLHMPGGAGQFLAEVRRRGHGVFGENDTQST